MIITNSSIIEGYNIKEYIGNRIGADTYTAAGLLGEGMAGSIQTKYLSIAYSNATSRMIQNAPSNANAFIGVNMTMTSVGSEILVAVSGTAVRIEKIMTEEEKAEIAKKEEEEKQRLEKYEQLKMERKKVELRREFGEEIDERILSFLCEIDSMDKLAAIYECWKKFGLEGDGEYADAERTIIKLAKLEKYSTKPNQSTVTEQKNKIKALLKK